MNEYPNPILISRGPALIEYQGAKFFSKGSIVFDFGVSQKAIERSAFGPGAMYPTKIAPTLKIPLVGAIENLSILFPFGAMMVGASIFSASPLTIMPIDTTQKAIVFNDAAVFKEPSLTLGSDQLALGDVTFRFRPTVGQPLTATNAWFTEVDNTWDGTGYEADTIIAQAYLATWLSQGTSTLTWGGDTSASFAYDEAASGVATALNALASIIAAGGVTVAGTFQEGYTVTFVTNGARAAFTGAVADMPAGTAWKQTVIQTGTGGAPAIVLLELTPWGQFSTEEAIKIETNPKIEEAKSSQLGFYDLIFGGTSAKCTMLPLNVPQTTLLAAANIQGSASGLGTAPTTANSADLAVYANGLYVVLYNSTPKPTQAFWDAAKQRVAPMEWNTGSNLASGIDTKYYVGTEAPE
jgi:hypothetical protein